jgi:cytochrome c-type biogenesis protein CcmH/NrfG
VIVFGAQGSPMEGIGMIKAVAERDPRNVYAQWMMGQASYMSGQMDKAAERFKNVAELQPQNLEATLLSADISEQLGNNEEAVKWYTRLLPLIDNPDMKKEVEARIAKLKK